MANKLLGLIWNHVVIFRRSRSSGQLVSRMFGQPVGGDTNVKACCQVPQDVKEDLKSVQLVWALKRKAESSQLDSATRTGLSTSASTNKGAVYGDLKAMLVSPPGGDAADKAVAEWTYHNGVPFNAVDSVYFSRMCKAVMEFVYRTV
jgi:hypothetical protein